VSESADKYEAKTAQKRGSGTRDEDKIKLRAKGSHPTATVKGLAEMVQAVKESDLGDEMRAMQPGDDDE